MRRASRCSRGTKQHSSRLALQCNLLNPARSSPSSLCPIHLAWSPSRPPASKCSNLRRQRSFNSSRCNSRSSSNNRCWSSSSNVPNWLRFNSCSSNRSSSLLYNNRQLWYNRTKISHKAAAVDSRSSRTKTLWALINSKSPSSSHRAAGSSATTAQLYLTILAVAPCRPIKCNVLLARLSLNSRHMTKLLWNPPSLSLEWPKTTQRSSWCSLRWLVPICSTRTSSRLRWFKTIWINSPISMVRASSHVTSNEHCKVIFTLGSQDTPMRDRRKTFRLRLLLSLIRNALLSTCIFCSYLNTLVHTVAARAEIYSGLLKFEPGLSRCVFARSCGLFTLTQYNEIIQTTYFHPH